MADAAHMAGRHLHAFNVLVPTADDLERTRPLGSLIDSAFGLLAEEDFPKRIAAVDEQPSTRAQRRGGPRSRPPLEFRMTPVERSDAHGEGNVEWLFAWFELEVLDRAMPEAQAPSRDLGSRRGRGRGDRLRRSVDRQDMAISDTPRDFARRGPGTASDLQHAKSRPEWKRVHDRCQAR